MSNYFSALESELNFSKTIFRIATSFVSIEDSYTIVNKALEELGKACNAGRSYLFVFNEDQKTMNNIYEWCKNEVTPEIENLQNLPLDTFPWWMTKLLNGEVIDIKDVEELPYSAKAEKEILQMQGIRSVLVLPLYISDKLSGFIGIDNVKDLGTWEKRSLEYLRVASNIIGSALSREKLQKEKEKMIQELGQIHKMEAIGHLAAGLAHEINTPIQFINDNTVFIKKVFESFQKITESLEISAQECEKKPLKEIKQLFEEIPHAINDTLDGVSRISNIVNAMKEFASHNSKSKTSTDLNKTINNVITISQNEWKYRAEIEKEFDSSIKNFRCYPDEMNQLMLALLINAAQSIAEKNLNNQSVKGKITITTKKHLDYIEIRIKDTGTGIPEHIKHKIFDPFFTTREIGKGMGQGLTTAYAIVVDKHEGNITFETEENKGTTFIIQLPIID